MWSNGGLYGVQIHVDESRMKIPLRWLQENGYKMDGSKISRQVWTWDGKQQYFDVCGDAFMSVILPDFTEKKKISFAEPTSPAIHLSREPEKTPRLDEESIQVPIKEPSASANLKVKKNVIKFKVSVARE